jgi:hypothetical protein
MLPVAAFGQQTSNQEANVQMAVTYVERGVAKEFPARGEDCRSDGGISILDETRKKDDTPDHICFVQWVPTESWRSSLERDPRNAHETIQDEVQMFDRYTVFIVIDAKKGGRAVLDYTPSELIRSTATMVSPQGDGSARPAH